ncbi:hypothetical protein GCM10007160_27910 [Litchfieldella qijiaojingensis]|uniref:Uncharacterized protein n=1 Tax=Litchfieldella qijiaojingensis TaxID=980347 RepID=A0ABQ2Z0Q0_9GAMM|nr:hypothetical protein GCM10007160_27910 [Halomonas qijiaojingensis]
MDPDTPAVFRFLRQASKGIYHDLMPEADAKYRTINIFYLTKKRSHGLHP